MNRPSGIQIECAIPTDSLVGEGAVWDHRDNVLWWVDISSGLIHKYDPDTGTNSSLYFGEPVGCLAVREQGGLVLATRSGLWLFDPETKTRQYLHDPEPCREQNRFNDGTTDRQGRFWAGTMKEGGDPEPIGRFYRLDPDLSLTPWIDGIYTTNGLTFSPDGNTLYYSDSNPAVRTIWSCPYDTKTGTPGEASVFFDTNSVAGRPDGGTVDAEGYYWMAGVGGWQLYRISPQGEVVLTIDMPIEKPTKPMFGGRDLDILFVTSIGVNLSPGTKTLQPQAGGVFAITGLGIKGIAQPRFAG